MGSTIRLVSQTILFSCWKHFCFPAKELDGLCVDASMVHGQDNALLHMQACQSPWLDARKNRCPSILLLFEMKTQKHCKSIAITGRSIEHAMAVSRSTFLGHQSFQAQKPSGDDVLVAKARAGRRVRLESLQMVRWNVCSSSGTLPRKPCDFPAVGCAAQELVFYRNPQENLWSKKQRL